MASFNKVILVGNLTRDPELRYTPKGMAIAKIGLAVNRKWTTECGEQREEVTFVDIDVFGRQAENLGQYKRKGDPLLVEGRLRLDQWEDRGTGQKRSKLSVVGEMIQYLGRSQGGGAESSDRDERRQTNDSRRQQQSEEAQTDNPTPDGDDVPF
jgi:single-strand DNA-binding protein